MHKALIILAHGSRNQIAIEQMMDLSRTLKQSQQLNYDHIKTAFLELAEPSLNTVVDQLAAQQVKSMVVMPYFLSSGNHVSRDIPHLVTESIERHPDCKIRLISYFGANNNVVEWVAKHVKNDVI